MSRRAVPEVECMGLVPCPAHLLSPSLTEVEAEELQRRQQPVVQDLRLMEQEAGRRQVA